MLLFALPAAYRFVWTLRSCACAKFLPLATTECTRVCTVPLPRKEKRNAELTFTPHPCRGRKPTSGCVASSNPKAAHADRHQYVHTIQGLRFICCLLCRSPISWDMRAVVVVVAASSSVVQGVCISGKCKIPQPCGGALFLSLVSTPAFICATAESSVFVCHSPTGVSEAERMYCLAGGAGGPSCECCRLLSS